MITHRLEVAGEDWTTRLVTASIQYRADVGSSGLEFTCLGSMEEYANAPIKLYLGEQGEDLPLYFKGKIHAPNDDDRLDQSKANAFGPFRNMQTQKLGTNETFVGRSLEWVIFECARRANHATGEILVIGGDKYHVQTGEQFPFDNNIGDVIKSLMDKAKFVGVDQPGGKRVFMPEPKAGSNRKFKYTIDPTEYWELDIAPKEDTAYSKVVVYRNGDGSTPEVYAERDITVLGRFPAEKLRWYVVSDFAGQSQEAEEEAFRLADELHAGTNSFSLKMHFDPDWQVHDGFKIVRIKKQQQRTYACFIDDGITVDYAPNSPAFMSVAGSCFELKHARETIQETEKRIAISGGLLQRPVTI